MRRDIISRIKYEDILCTHHTWKHRSQTVCGTVSFHQDKSSPQLCTSSSDHKDCGNIHCHGERSRPYLLVNEKWFHILVDYIDGTLMCTIFYYLMHQLTCLHMLAALQDRMVCKPCLMGSQLLSREMEF